MNKPQRDALTRSLSSHVGAIAADLRAQMVADDAVRERAKQLHLDEQVGEDFEVWIDLLSRRAAVLWVLKTVYVRVLEDRGLLRPGRLLDAEAQQLFEKLAPNLGETAFLSWLFRDLASPRGGLPELFARQPAEVAVPADKLSRALIEFWRTQDVDTNFRWSFAGEAFAGELMGDLYQELDPVVRERYALCQTPNFVRDFMLERTLTPAVAEYGADVVRVLDPSCGSGHFLLDALVRLVEATEQQHPDWSRRSIVEHALERVVGIDLNDYACALARARLVMTAAELAGISRLEEAARLRPHVYWADGLEQVEKDVEHVQLDLLDSDIEQAPRATLSAPEVRVALRTVLRPRFHAIVANPPYIVERDARRKRYYEEGAKKRRYQSAWKQYHLSSPFIERCRQLAHDNAFVGVIVDNQFMKRDYGRPLIERVLSRVDLTLVVDTSKAQIPHHGTPTVIMFFRACLPTRDHVPVVIGLRDESKSGAAPGAGPLWNLLRTSPLPASYRDEHVALREIKRDELNVHPWTWTSSDASSLKERIERDATPLETLAKAVGKAAAFGEDGVYVMSRDAAERLGIADSVAPLVIGAGVRDWTVTADGVAVYPYASWGGEPLSQESPVVQRYFWRYRTLLRQRTIFGSTLEQKHRRWFEYLEHYRERIADPRSIVYAIVSTHNHFALDRGGKVLNQSARVVKLAPGVDDGEYLVLTAILNSSTACYWFKQVLQPRTHASQNHHPDPSRGVYELSAAAVSAFPIPELSAYRTRLLELARLVDSIASEKLALFELRHVHELIQSSRDSAHLREGLAARWAAHECARERLIALQEEIDWIIYSALGIADETCLLDPTRYDAMTCPRGDRPFERIFGRQSTVRAKGKTLSRAEAEAEPQGTLPDWAETVWVARLSAIQKSEDLKVVETPVFKRAWRDTDRNMPEPKFRADCDERALRDWLCSRLESWARRRSTCFTLGQLVSAVQDDGALLRVAELLAGRKDYSLETLVATLVRSDAVPNHRVHVYTKSGLAKHAAWAEIWRRQRDEDMKPSAAQIAVDVPEYSQGSRGKSTDFQRAEYWGIRGKLDVPLERFIVFLEVPAKSGGTRYGWAGWSPIERMRALLAIDEEIENGGCSVAERIGILDSAWALLDYVADESPEVAARFRAELQAIVGPDGPSAVLVDEWQRTQSTTQTASTSDSEDEEDSE